MQPNGWNDIRYDDTMNNNTKQYETHNKSAQQSDPSLFTGSAV